MPVVCIIHVMHNKELRTMTVRNDSKQDVGMGFLIYCWAGLEMRWRWAGVHIPGADGERRQPEGGIWKDAS